MHKVQKDVLRFHTALGIPTGNYQRPAIARPELRAELIREESKETRTALGQGNLIKVIDGLCDILCVTYGTAVEMGINLAPFWAEVHRSNMEKQGGPVRADGKVLKPPGWRGPNLEKVLREQPGLIR